MSKTAEQWDLKPLFKGETDPNIEKTLRHMERQADRFNKRWSGRKDYLTNAAVLARALADYDRYLTSYQDDSGTAYYFDLRNALDQTDTKVKARQNQVNQRINNIRNQIEFFELNLGQISLAKQRQFLKNPELESYRYFLVRIFRFAKHMLSLEQEQILNLKRLPSHELWVQMTAAMISAATRNVVGEHGKKRPANFEEIASLMDSPKKAVRDDAARAFNDILRDNLEPATNELNAILTNKKIDDDLRGYARPDQARHLSDGVDAKTIDTLLAAVTSQNQLAKDFYRLKAQLLGLKKLAYHERNLLYGNLTQSYSYPQAVKTVDSAFEEIDSESAATFRSFIKNRQIDVYPSKGKRGGAFCTSNSASQPTYILLNYTHKLRDVSTLAHEMGHGIHAELTKKNQPALYLGVSMATAEVASNYFEGLVFEKLKAGLNDEQKLALLMTDLNDTVSSTFRQAAFYKFEMDLHTKFRASGYLSASEIGQIFSQHMRAYMGPAVSSDPGSENWWTYIPHFRDFFYVYSYVSGLLIAKALQKYTYSQPGFVSKVKESLAAGNSADAHDIFKKLGIDMNSRHFWLDGLGQIRAQLQEARQLAKRLGKLN